MIISVALMGGLGNQLFQIFFCLAYARYNNYSCIFPYSGFIEEGIVRNTYWENFLQPLKVYTTYDDTVEIIQQRNAELYSFPKYHEDRYKYNYQIDINGYSNIQFVGFFQSYKYFQSEFGNLCKIINLSQHQASVFEEYRIYFSDDFVTISMHFRLADYKHQQDRHPVLKYEYYENALKHLLYKIQNQQNNIRVLYFCESEDINYVETVIERLTNNVNRVYSGSIEYVKVHDNIEDWKQLLLMSLAEHNIIANSSFSWWAAYFNQNLNKVVIYPLTWFGPSLANILPVDMFPAQWIPMCETTDRNTCSVSNHVQ